MGTCLAIVKFNDNTYYYTSYSTVSDYLDCNITLNYSEWSTANNACDCNCDKENVSIYISSYGSYIKGKACKKHNLVLGDYVEDENALPWEDLNYLEYKDSWFELWKKDDSIVIN